MELNIITILCLSTYATVTARSLHAKSDLWYENYKSDFYENDSEAYELFDTSFGQRIGTLSSTYEGEDKNESFKNGENVYQPNIKEDNTRLTLPIISDKDFETSESDINPISNSCPKGEILNAIGTCTKPEVSKKIYIYGPPKESLSMNLNSSVPSPEIQYNIILVKTPDKIKGPDPIIASAPRHKTIVYILQKKSQKKPKRKIIKVPSPKRHKPQVFYGNYDEEQESYISNPQFQKPISTIVLPLKRHKPEVSYANYDEEQESHVSYPKFQKPISAIVPPQRRLKPEVSYTNYDEEQESHLSYPKFQKPIYSVEFNDKTETTTKRKMVTQNKSYFPSDVEYGARTDYGGGFSWYSEYSLK